MTMTDQTDSKARVVETIREHNDCSILFNDGGGATFCDGSSLGDGDFASIADARVTHLASVLADSGVLYEPSRRKIKSKTLLAQRDAARAELADAERRGAVAALRDFRRLVTRYYPPSLVRRGQVLADLNERLARIEGDDRG